MPPTAGAKYGKASSIQTSERTRFAPKPAFSKVSALATLTPVHSLPTLQPVIDGNRIVEISTQPSQSRIMATRWTPSPT